MLNRITGGIWHSSCATVILQRKLCSMINQQETYNVFSISSAPFWVFYIKRHVNPCSSPSVVLSVTNHLILNKNSFWDENLFLTVKCNATHCKASEGWIIRKDILESLHASITKIATCKKKKKKTWTWIGTVNEQLTLDINITKSWIDVQSSCESLWPRIAYSVTCFVPSSIIHY